MSVAQLAIVSSEADREEDLVVQPVSVAYVRLCGLPMGRQFRPFFAWYGGSEEHTSELQSLMRISYAVFCLKKKKTKQKRTTHQYDRPNNNRKNNNKHDQ